MAGAQVTITVDDAAVRAALARLVAHTKNLRPALAEIGEVITASTQHRFSTQTAPDGTRWAPNTALTLARFLDRTKGNYKKSGALSKAGARRLGNKRPLTLTGTLGDSIAPRVGVAEVRIGTAVVYAAVHQFGAKAGSLGRTRRGGPIPWGDIPARPFLGLSADDRARILEILSDYLQDVRSPEHPG